VTRYGYGKSLCADVAIDGYRVQISTDGLNAYVAAMQNAFGEFVDYGQIIKTYGHEEVTTIAATGSKLFRLRKGGYRIPDER